jgi:glyoxylase-like metal-dependent hydrolase (beta-lactamase superfamily II)
VLENQDFRPTQENRAPGSLSALDLLSPSEVSQWVLEEDLKPAVTPWRWRRWLGALLIAIALAIPAAAAVFAPYVYAELYSREEPHAIIAPGMPALAKGEMVDDYWAVQKLDGATYAIGEPRYYQGNYAYLLLGRKRALLFDSGSGTRDISPVVAELTKLPVTVIPSHLHYDHLGGIEPFSSVAMVDLPETRAAVVDGRLEVGRYDYLGFIDGRQPPYVRVTQWLKPGARIDLGGRIVQLIHTPGHTSLSVSLFDPARRQLFSGDFIYPTTLYASLPGGSLSAYQQTASRLLATLPADTTIWSAHCCRIGEQISAPWLTMTDLRDLDRTLRAIEAGQAHATGFYPRIYPVNREMTLATGFPWNNR